MDTLSTINKQDLLIFLENNVGYKQIYDKYLDYIQYNYTTKAKDTYRFIYPDSNIQVYERKLMFENWGSLEFIKLIGIDLGLYISLSYISPFRLNISSLDSNEFLSETSIQKCVLNISSYSNNNKLNIFLDLFYEYIKPLGINFTVNLEID